MTARRQGARAGGCTWTENRWAPAGSHGPSLGRIRPRWIEVLDVATISLLVVDDRDRLHAVLTRKLFRFVFAWSEEVTLLCLTWFTFMGIAIGFRERLHLGMDMVENLLPKR